jgi:hypothetical protein
MEVVKVILDDIINNVVDKDKEIGRENENENENEKNRDYQTLVLSGGGMKGIALLGALQQLQDTLYLQSIDKVIGTSIGAMIGYLWIIGYSPIELMVLLCHKQHQELLQSLSLTRWDMVNCLEGNRGAISYMLIHELLEKLSLDKISTLLTLQQIKQMFGKELICCTYNRSLHKTEFLDSTKYPDLPCLTALRMSAAIPFIFDPCFFNNNLYVDGGIVENIPLSPLDEKEKCLVLYFKHPMKQPISKKTEFSFIENMSDLFITVIHQFEHSLLEIFQRKQGHPSPSRFIPILLSIESTLHFNLPKSEIFDMFSLGYQTCKNNT